MEHPVQLNRILLVLLMMTACATRGTVVKKTYTALKPGQDVTGKIVETNSPHILDCSRRCKSDDWCVGCATTSDERYVIIHRRGTKQEKQTLVSDVGGAIYTSNYTWNYTTAIESPVGSWNEPPPALYYNFDTLTGLTLMAGSGASNYDALVPGKINKAVVTDSSQKQWVDLGVLSEACITIPNSCAPGGAAISVWVKIRSCFNYDGFLSSLKRSSSVKTGFMFMCSVASIRNYVAVKTGSFWEDVPKTNDQWIHQVLNFIGIQAFKDGTLRDSQEHGNTRTQTDGDGRVVVGRRYVNKDYDYARVEVDELIFFNKALKGEEVRELYNMYQ